MSTEEETLLLPYSEETVSAPKTEPKPESVSDAKADADAEEETYSDYLFDSMKSFFKLLDKKANQISKSPIVEQMTKDLNRAVDQFNQDSNENIDILKRDLTALLKKKEKNIGLTAGELRQKAIEEFYQEIKTIVYANKNYCSCHLEIKTTSPKILLGLKEKLDDEGFDVQMEAKEISTFIKLQW